eukprot:TRINITY_DN4070_c1_g1_i5.p1 TRINITY_DN4070_c1_g1~~TRINITY_DN4070_c1_g1_i5.p1  ORF type:complete len:105 (+),score=14.86 TRINITY_DN4070_c1_g1_i5:220-534(+)
MAPISKKTLKDAMLQVAVSVSSGVVTETLRRCFSVGPTLRVLFGYTGEVEPPTPEVDLLLRSRFVCSYVPYLAVAALFFEAAAGKFIADLVVCEVPGATASNTQ